MRFYFFGFFILFLFAKGSIAQSKQLGKYAISIQPLQLFCRDVPITFERIYPRHTLGFTLGYRFDSKLVDNPISSVKYFAGNFEFTSPRFKGVTIGVLSKYYVNKKELLYVEAQVFYRYWWFNNRFYDVRYDGSNPPDQEWIASLNNHIVGTKFLFGNTIVSKKEKSIKSVLNMYFGIGCRLKFLNEQGVTRYSYDDGSNTPFTVFNVKKSEILPSVHCGFSLGLLINKKEKLTLN